MKTTLLLVVLSVYFTPDTGYVCKVRQVDPPIQDQALRHLDTIGTVYSAQRYRVGDTLTLEAK